MTDGAPQSSYSAVGVVWGAIWLSLAITAAAAIAILISDEDEGVSLVVAHPLPSELPQALFCGDIDGVFSLNLVCSCSFWPSHPCAVFTSVHGNPSD